MEEHGEAERIDDIEPLAMSKSDYNETVETLFRERFGGYNAIDPLHARLRKALLASIEVCEADDSKVLVCGEAGRLMRHWLEEHGR